MFVRNKIINNTIKLKLKTLKIAKLLTPYYSKKLEKNISLSAEKNFSNILMKLNKL